jgi:hypothetical protein
MIRGQHTAARRRREGKKEKVCQMLHDLHDASRALARLRRFRLKRDTRIAAPAPSAIVRSCLDLTRR